MEDPGLSSAEHCHVFQLSGTVVAAAQVYFIRSIPGKYSIVGMLSREQLQEAELADIFHTTETRNLVDDALDVSTQLQNRVKEAFLVFAVHEDELLKMVVSLFGSQASRVSI